MGMISPDDLMTAAKAEMLGGKNPVSREDYMRLMNYFAVNIAPGVAHAACGLMAQIYEMPLTESDITAIVQFQLDRKQEASDVPSS